MAANTHQYQMKRTSVSGRLANTTDSSNTSYIPAGALAVNFADQTFYTSNGTSLIQVGSNVTNLNVTSTLTVNGASINATSFSGTANNALNLAGQPASYYTNATNITTGTLNPARLALSGVVANTYGNASYIPVITVDSAGRVTNVSTSAVAGVTGFNYYSANSTITLTTGDGSSYTATINQANSTVSGLVEIVDSTSNTSSTVAASANAVYVAYNAAQNAYSNALARAASLYLPLTGGIINGSLTITGNVVMAGNTTFVNTSVISTTDKAIYLSANSPSSLLSDGSGIIATNAASFLYNNSTTSWQSNVNFTPSTNNTLNLGSASLAWGNVYSNNASFSYINLADYTAFTPLATAPTWAQGLLFYGQNNDSLTFFDSVSGNDLNLGREIQLRVYNNTGSIIPIGSVVYINGQHSQFPAVALAQANSSATTNAIGMTNTSIPDKSYGDVVVVGKFTGVDTHSFNSGDALYLSATTAGGLTNVAPTYPNYVSVLGYCIYSNPSNGVVELTMPLPPTMISQIYGAGTMASQNASAVSITNGTINATSLSVDLVFVANSSGITGTLLTTSQPNITANNSTNFGGISLSTVQSQITGNATTAYTNAVANAAALYQTTAGLAANVVTLAANSATYLGNSSGTIANIASWVTGNAASAYTNAIAFAANASTINSGSIGVSYLPANLVFWSNTNSFSATQTFNANVVVAGNSTSSIVVGNNLTSNLIANSSTLLIQSGSTVGQFQANSIQFGVGNSTVNTYSNSTHFFAGNSTSYGFCNSTVEALVTANSTANISVYTINSSSANVGNTTVYGFGNSSVGSLVFANSTANLSVATLSSNTLQIGNSTVYTSVNSTAFSGTANNATNLGGFTWISPGAIGSTTANTGNFTTANAATITVGSSFIANTTVLKSTGLANISGNAVFGSTMTIGGTAASASAWTTNGVGMIQSAATFTDTSTAASGTVPTAYMNLFAAQTYAATNVSVTVSNLYGTYFTAPTAGTNVTATASYAIGCYGLAVGGPLNLNPSGLCQMVTNGTAIQITSQGSDTLSIQNQATSGVTNIGASAGTGTISIGRSTASQTLNLHTGATTSGNTKTVNIGTGSLSGATSTITIGSSVSGATQTTTINGRVTFAPIGATVAAWSTSGVGLIQSAATFTDNTTAASGTVATAYMNLFDAQTYAATNAITVTNLYGTYFKTPTAGANVTATNRYALAADSIYVAGSASLPSVTAFSQGSTLFTLAGTAAGNHSVATALTTGTLNIATAVSASGNTKTINIGTNGVSGSTTNINIGSAVSGATSTTTLNGSTIATGTLQLAAYTVATLPAAGTAGRRAYVTDATAPSWLGTVTGGGSVKCPVFDNGTAWVAG